MKSILFISALLLGMAANGQSFPAILCDSIQKVFTPNDDKIDDLFSIEPQVLNHEKTESFNLKIYNRWGELVFESDDFRKPWDGKDKKNKPAASGVYVYLARLSISNGPAGECKGTITLLR